MEMQSFGWIICRVFRNAPEAPNGAYRQYLSGLPDIPLTEKNKCDIRFANSQHSAEIWWDENARDAVLSWLRELWPQCEYEAKELFWKGPDA